MRGRLLRTGHTRAAALIVLALLVAACGQRDTTAAGSLINRGLSAEPESLDNHKARSVESGDVLRDLGEGLVGYSPSGELVGAAASHWEMSEDGLEYRFSLRPEARWSNGDTVTSDDFVYSFRRLVDPVTAAFYAQFIGDIVNAREIIAGDMPPAELGVEASEEFELTIRLRNPVPYLLGLLTHPATFPVHRGSLEEHGAAHARPGNRLSNGAYTLVAWDVGSLIELERNEHYWNDAATSIDRVRYHLVPEPMVELNRYRAGELDVTRSVPTEAFAQLREERPDELRVSPYLGVYYYGFNLTRPPFRGNRKLRQALSMAIDRESITENIVIRGETAAYSWVPPGTAGYTAPRFTYADMSRDERHAAARRLYREAGYGEDNPLEVEIRYNTSETQARIAVAIKSMWRDVLGVEAKLINEELQVLLDNIQQKENTEVFRLSWTGDYNDAHAFLSVMESGNPSNLPGFENEEFDEYMRRAARQTKPEMRQRLLEEAERELLAEHPVIPLYFYVNKNLVSPRVSGWSDNVLNYHYTQHLSITGPE